MRMHMQSGADCDRRSSRGQRSAGAQGTAPVAATTAFSRPAGAKPAQCDSSPARCDSSPAQCDSSPTQCDSSPAQCDSRALKMRGCAGIL
jgi:hypothetical protein